MAARARRQPGLIFTLLLGLALSGKVCARADIVFLLQQPGRGEPAFFELAAEHYRAQASVVLVVNSARSLLQVRELLQRSPLRGQEPWGNIVLVAHGSRWTGLSLPIFDDEGIPEPGVWRRVRERGEFVPLSDEVADAETRLRVDSCGLGARPDLLRELAALLGGEPRLKVEAAVGRVEFRQDPQHPNIPPTRHELAYGAKVRPRSYALSTVRMGSDGSRELPIEFRQPLLQASHCDDIDIAGLLRRGTTMANTLRDYGLRPRDLHFDMDDSSTDCLLRGRGVLIVDAEASTWPLESIGSTVTEAR